jgi:hypothetical protein
MAPNSPLSPPKAGPPVVAPMVGPPAAAPKGEPSVPTAITPALAGPTWSSFATVVASYMNNVTLSKRTLSLSGVTPEDLALQWLALNNTLNMTLPLSDSDFARLRQRFALASTWFQQFYTGKYWKCNSYECNDDDDCVSVSSTCLNETWLVVENECTWLGVSCSSLNKTQRLDLNDINIHGTIPPDLGWLTGMEVLNMDGNNLAGSLPTSIGLWTNLNTIQLGWNQLSTSTMWWGPCRRFPAFVPKMALEQSCKPTVTP